MPKFEYKGRNNNGMEVKGIIDALTVDAAAGQLIDNGVTPLTIDKFQEKRDYWYEFRNWLGLEQPNADDLILFCRQCYTLNRSGIPIIRGFKLLADSARKKNFALIINEMADDLEAGRELSVAMSRNPKVFTSLFVNMIRMGETSGRIDDAFLHLFNYLERDKETRNQIKAAVRYPTFVLITLIAAVFIVMTFVIPKFAEFYNANHLELPIPTKIIMTVSNFMVSYWYLILGGVVFGIFSFQRYINTEAGRLWWDEKKIKLILIGDIMLRAVLSRLARTLSMALDAGVPILQAISITAGALGNEYLALKVMNMREGIERGESLSRTANKSDVFTPLVMQMISVGEETGRLDEMLDEVAGFYEREVDYDVKHINSIIEPLLTVGMAALVLLLMLGIFLPMWNLVELIKR